MPAVDWLVLLLAVVFGLAVMGAAVWAVCRLVLRHRAAEAGRSLGIWRDGVPGQPITAEQYRAKLAEGFGRCTRCTRKPREKV